ncbi:hypothetical protein, partial [Thiohalospira sp.]|uniref:hypothetical protein n=1 Tax=Thiohalospira sp. TaxID=3080549 RepID=UPI00397E97F1
ASGKPLADDGDDYDGWTVDVEVANEGDWLGANGRWVIITVEWPAGTDSDSIKLHAFRAG